MSFSSIKRLVLLLAVAFVAFASASKSFAEPYFQGTKSCEECHKDEYKAWERTKHYSSYRSAHKHKDAKKIAKAVGGKKSMKRNKNCVVCHYATEQKKAEDKPKVRFGPACESCHGASSVWEPIHSDYGGKDAKRENETGEHKTKRIADSVAAGLVWSTMNYEVAAQCMKCHGLARSEISGDAFAKMLGAGHPINQSFEIVMFSQGKMRHWPKERSKARLSRLFVAGQAAKLVSATEAAAKTEDAKYKEAQTKRATDAKAVLQAIPQAAAGSQSPSDEKARKMMQAIGQQDLAGQIGGLMKCAAADQENLWQCN